MRTIPCAKLISYPIIALTVIVNTHRGYINRTIGINSSHHKCCGIIAILNVAKSKDSTFVGSVILYCF